MKDPIERAEFGSPGPTSGAPSVTGAKRFLLGVAWFALWFATLMACAQAAYAFWLEPNEADGFGAMLGMLGLIWGGPIGFVLSSMVARKSGRTWPFFAGALLTGAGTVAWLLSDDWGIFGLPFRVIEVLLASPIVWGLGLIWAVVVLVRARAERKAKTSAPP